VVGIGEQERSRDRLGCEWGIFLFFALRLLLILEFCLLQD